MTFDMPTVLMCPPPVVDESGPLQFQAVTLGYDAFVGRLVIGRVMRGRMKRSEPVVRVRDEGSPDSFRITKLFGTRGIDRVELDEALAETRRAPLNGWMPLVHRRDGAFTNW